MHPIKPYLLDLFIGATAFTGRKIAVVTGSAVIETYWHTDKVLYVFVMLITGSTSLYRFVKEVRNDRQRKQKDSEKSK